MLKSLFFIFIGGGTGSIVRYLLHWYINQKIQTVFPWATLIANIIASFVVGFLTERINFYGLPLWYRYVFITGFCGGLSTFSTFSYENVMFITDKQLVLSTMYTIVSVVLCFVFTFLGIWISRKI